MGRRREHFKPRLPFPFLLISNWSMPWLIFYVKKLMLYFWKHQVLLLSRVIIPLCKNAFFLYEIADNTFKICPANLPLFIQAIVIWFHELIKYSGILLNGLYRSKRLRNGKRSSYTGNSSGHTSHELKRPDKTPWPSCMMLDDFKKRFWVSFIITIPISCSPPDPGISGF